MQPVAGKGDPASPGVEASATGPGGTSKRGTVLMGATPVPAGSYTAFLRLREGLAPFGWEVVGVSTSKQAWDPTVSHEGCVSLDTPADDQRATAMRFLELVEEQDATLIVPNNGPGITSAIPHLPTRVGVIMRCNNTTAHAYHHVAAHPDHVHAVICLSPRQQDDLDESWNIPRERLRLIPNGVRIPDQPIKAPSSAERRDELQITYLGRLHDASKGIFTIPGILRELDHQKVSYRLSLIGTGPDENELLRRLERARPRGPVDFIGALAQDEVAPRLIGADLLLMPSRFEGFASVLIEAMACGLVPVASRLPGVTDSIVDEGRSGFLCRPGDEKAFAAAIGRLARDRAGLLRMQTAAREAAVKRFSLTSMAASYDRVFTEALNNPCESRPEPLPLSDWKPYERYVSPRARLMRKVPKSLRNLGRTLNPASKGH